MNNIVPCIAETGHLVKAEKLEDVRNLLQKHYGAEWQNIPQHKYYKNVLSGDIGQNGT